MIGFFAMPCSISGVTTFATDRPMNMSAPFERLGERARRRSGTRTRLL
jgi:hypothetical protein